MSVLPYATPLPGRTAGFGPGLSADPSNLGARVKSLDVFRGITIAGMILVNNAGDWEHVYTPLEHSKWDGCTPTDLVFPFFLFIVGVAIPFSLASRRQKLATEGNTVEEQNRAILLNIIRRAAILFAIGVAIFAIPLNFHRGQPNMGILDPSSLRIPGVLQRIAVCYLAAALLTNSFGWRTRAAIGIALLIVYTLLMRLVPVPGFGPDVLAKDGSLASWLDRFIFGHHTYKPEYDPEGLLSTLPAIVTTLIGTLVGQWLRVNKPPMEKAAAMLAFGVIGAVFGYLTNGLLLPINKALWTPSYVLLSGGYALLGFGLCYWIIDVHCKGRWALPFMIYGMNAIGIYVFASVLGRITLMIKMPSEAGPIYLKVWLYEHLFGRLTQSPMHLSPYLASAMWGLGYVLLCLALATWMYRRRIFLKV